MVSRARGHAGLLAVMAVATVAAVAVIGVYHTTSSTELLAKPHAFVKNGVEFVPRRVYEARPGQPLPKGAIIINKSALKMAKPKTYHNAPGLPQQALKRKVFHPVRAFTSKAFHPLRRQHKTVVGHARQLKKTFGRTKLHAAHHNHGLKVAKAFPLKQPHNMQNGGKYGHLTENILTSHSGPVHIKPGSFRQHLRGASPAVAPKAGVHLMSKRQMKMHQQARELAEALDDCRDDAQDDCQTELHLHDKHLKAFEQDQDAADKGLFRIFEAAQRIPDANGIRFPQGSMLAQMPRTASVIPGQSPGVDGFGIPKTGSLPGDDV